MADFSTFYQPTQLKSKYDDYKSKIKELKEYAADKEKFGACEDEDTQQIYIDTINSIDDKLESAVSDIIDHITKLKDLLLNVQNCIALVGDNKKSFISNSLDKLQSQMDGDDLSGLSPIDDLYDLLIVNKEDPCAQESINLLYQAHDVTRNAANVASDAKDKIDDAIDKSHSFVSTIAKMGALINCIDNEFISDPKMSTVLSTLEPHLTNTTNLIQSASNKAQTAKKAIDDIRNSTGISDTLNGLFT